MRKKTIRGAVVQLKCEAGAVAANTEKALSLAESAVADGASVVALPELFNTGYGFPETDRELAEEIPGPTTERCLLFSQRTGALLVAAILERSGEDLYDTAIVCGPDGSLKTYRKVHLWKGEERRWKRGTRLLPPVSFAGIKVGVLICHDLRYPEAARSLALRGATLLIYSSAFGAPRLYSWDNQTRARAMENGVFAMFANRTGKDGDIEFAGHSRIVDPFGKPLVDLSESVEGYATADMNLEMVETARAEVPQLPQINPRLYSYLRWKRGTCAQARRRSGTPLG